MDRGRARFWSVLLVGLIGLGTLSGTVAAETQRQHRKPPSVTTAEAASAELRAMYFAQDFYGGRFEGKKLVTKFPESTALRAWYLLHRSRYFLDRESVAEAETLVAEGPDDPWSWFALAGALQRNSERSTEALRASRKALSLARTDPDFLWLRASVLASEGTYPEAIAFIDRARSKVENPAELLVVRAAAIRRNAYQDNKINQAKLDAALRDLEEARRIDPLNVNAHARAGEFLLFAHRVTEAYPLFKKAIDLAPLSLPPYGLKWRAIQGLPDLTPGKKRAEIEADIRILLKERGDYPEILPDIALEYGELGLARQQREMEDRILRLYPESAQAEWVLVTRWRRYAKEGGKEGRKDPKRQAAYRKMLRDFIQRPQHRVESLQGEAYVDLFLSVKDDSLVSGDEILELVNGMVQHERINRHITQVQGPIALADRRAHLQEAERIILDGMTSNLQEERNRKHASHYGGRRGQKGWAKYMRGQFLDALGWVHFSQGRMQEAEKALIRSLKLSPGRMETLYHLGKLADVQGDLRKAEEYYAKGIAIETTGENPSEKAIRDLYVRRYGSEEGFESYLGKFKNEDRTKRKERILADRIASPQAVPVFSLKSLDGKRVALADLQGKIAIINFWGLWCGWCLEEMTDIQKLHEKYRSDSGLVILTLDNDPNPDSVRKWMNQKKFNFRVLLDDGYVQKAGVRGFPTTWFLDRQGRMVFTKVGWSQELVEEFGWRIEALKADDSPIM